MTTQHLGYEWCLPPDGDPAYLKAHDFQMADLVAINTTAGWLVLVEHRKVIDPETGYGLVSEYVRPSELRQKP